MLNDSCDAFPEIDATEGVAGGDLCIAGTRIPVWVLEQARRLGASEQELLRSYPILRPENLAAAWLHARAHRDEIDAQIRENETA